MVASSPRDALPMVEPLARALAVLSVFAPQDRWLGHGELVARTGMPASTVARLARSLVLLGYLLQDAASRRYRLAASVLALGYAAIAQSDVQRLARPRMQAFAERHQVHVSLSMRDRLDLVLLECSGAVAAPGAAGLQVGVRMGIASSPMGWALLAALPEPERYYLLGNVERRLPREWPRLRRRTGEAISQTYETGFCTSLGEWDRTLGIVAAPLVVPSQEPFALACVGPSRQMSRARAERELGPHLLGMALQVQEQAAGQA